MDNGFVSACQMDINITSLRVLMGLTLVADSPGASPTLYLWLRTPYRSIAHSCADRSQCNTPAVPPRPLHPPSPLP